MDYNSQRTIMSADAFVNGAEGECYIRVDGKWENLMSVKSLDATLDKNVETVSRLGMRQKAHKTTSTEGTGSMTTYFVTSLFARKAKEYLDTGKEFYFDIQVINHDAASGIGTQDVILKHCSVTSIPITKLDIDDSNLEIDLDFNFDDYDLNSEFETTTGVGDAAR